jgi:hypothetical protein
LLDTGHFVAEHRRTHRVDLVLHFNGIHFRCFPQLKLANFNHAVQRTQSTQFTSFHLEFVRLASTF